MDEDLIKRLRSLEIEDFIWIVLIGLILLSFYANDIERDFLITGNEFQKERYRNITIFIFSVALLTYLYYAADNRKGYFKLKPTDSKKKIINTTLSYVSSLLIVFAGIILVYIAITDTDLDIELAYN